MAPICRRRFCRSTPRISVCTMRGKEILCQALYWQLGRFISYESLKEVLWGYTEDGGPLYSQKIINQYIFRLRNDGNVIETWPKQSPPLQGARMLARAAPRNLDGAHKFYLMEA